MNVSTHSEVHFSWLTAIFTGHPRQSQSPLPEGDAFSVSLPLCIYDTLYRMQHGIAKEYCFIYTPSTYELSAVLWILSKASKSIQGYNLFLFHNIPPSVGPTDITVPVSACGNTSLACGSFFPVLQDRIFPRWLSSDESVNLSAHQ